MKVDIVTGLGYGDEGKGVTTKWLSLSSYNPLIVRFGGGNQVGHTVMEGSLLHEHHHTGSGSTSNKDTFYSRFCTVEPIGTYDEICRLKLEAGFKFKQYYDPRAMLVTPLDVYANKSDNKESYKSVGVGFGRTIQRNEDHHHLYVQDILNKDIFFAKCNEVCNYYDNTFDIEKYYIICLEFLSMVNIKKLSELTYNRSGLIFEGHQGVLLDMEYGVFPYVTRSKTTVKNVFTILEEEGIEISELNNYMVTRAYHTRHGDGPFTETDIKLINNEHETNKMSPNQGPFKKSHINKKLLEFGIRSNLNDLKNVHVKRSNNLVITCMDQIDNSTEAFDIITRTAFGVSKFDIIYTNTSPKSTTITRSDEPIFSNL